MQRDDKGAVRNVCKIKVRRGQRGNRPRGNASRGSDRFNIGLQKRARCNARWGLSTAVSIHQTFTGPDSFWASAVLRQARVQPARLSPLPLFLISLETLPQLERINGKVPKLKGQNSLYQCFLVLMSKLSGSSFACGLLPIIIIIIFFLFSKAHA